MSGSFFGLNREPFSVAPDPQFVYMSEKHREALAYLMYGLRRGGGFVLLTGEIGAGKTTIWRCFLEQMPSNIDVAYVVNPKLGAQALLARVCEDLGVEPPEGGVIADPVDALHGHLLLAHARGRRTLIVVDEAQALAPEVLEQLRLLTNLDTGDRKLVQMLLIGQPELRTVLETPALEPVAQRVVARFHLPPLAEPDTVRYVSHRLAVAGLTGDSPFDSDALGQVHRLCGGVPRRINVLCDRALFAAEAQGSRRVTRAIVDHAAGEVFGLRPRAAPSSATERAVPPPAAPPAARGWALAGIVAAAVGGGVLLAPLVVPRLAAWLQPLAQPAGGNVAIATGATGATGVAASPGSAGQAAPPDDAARAAREAATARAEAAPRTAPATAREPGLRPGDDAALTASRSGALVARAPAPASPPGVATPALAAATASAASLPVSASGSASPSTSASASPVAGLDPFFARPSASEADAWRALAPLWGVQLAPGDPCVAAAQKAVRCYRIRSGLAPIRELGRPGIVTLVDDRGRSTRALLVGLSADTATLRLGDTDQTVPLATLARAWRGDFATLWRAPSGYAEGDVVASGGPLGEWLATRLNAIEGRPTSTADDGALAQRIYAFQLAHGLPPDGLAGPLTLMQINRASGVDEPRLVGGR